ncbi:glycosyltransferase WbsX family protein [Baia soyae]|uniref:Glycosyl transferase family WbsX n=1 Tax=Baia soyae TaxID=1544746 RepID=A0A4R2SE22_9BACL|nr:glycoside hydrolase family 99-like domain-containing protein [Baia soyae]TCP69308.1 glycosyl transferase family WbsX [Baia soyae]
MNLSSTEEPKVIALYLPQFHRVIENDKWWGEGFTEWTNTRKATPLFPGHYQPREPLHDFYYDLTDPDARKWQADIAKEHGVFGFCYYHYWFKGKMLLETPLNEVLRLGEPDFPFCLSWANETWSRRWNGADQDILMAQEYGDEEDWKEHFDYLVQAFKDPRYICIDQKPLFTIYRAGDIPRYREMLSYWTDLAKQHGFEGIYFVETVSGRPPFKELDGFDATFEFEPTYTLAWDRANRSEIVRQVPSDQNPNKSFRLYDYDGMWERILKRNPDRGEKKTILGAFVDWDNSARVGERASAFTISDSTPEKFGNHMAEQLERAEQMRSPFVFVNAWNEWAEGTYLEPDKKHGLRYLEELKRAVEQASGKKKQPR